MRYYLVTGGMLSCVAFLASLGFGHQASSFGIRIHDADAPAIWGGQNLCYPGYIQGPGNACTTQGPNSCAYDGMDYGCQNQCGIQCTNQIDWNAGGLQNGYIEPGAPCANYQEATCDSTGGESCGCGSPYTPQECQPTPWIFIPCVKG
jgi:hypothetical protein